MSANSWKSHGVHSLIDEIPDDLTKVHWAPKVEANLGNELTPEQTKTQPKIQFAHEEKANYTIMCVDADPPSRENPVNRYWLHHLVVNAQSQKKGDFVDLHHTGKTLAPYNGPAPPTDSGLHRYIYLVFKQHEFVETTDLPTFDNKNRGGFDIGEWKKRYAKGVELVSGNFWQSKHA